MSLTIRDPFLYKPVMERYGFQPETPFDWRKHLLGRAVQPSDLGELVRGIAFWYEGHEMKRAPNCNSKNPRFYCASCHVIKENSAFCLKFRKGGEMFFLVSESTFLHVVGCKPTKALSRNMKGRVDGKVIDFLKSSPLLYTFFKLCHRASDFEQAASRTKSIQLLENAGYDIPVAANLFTQIKLYFRALL